MIRLPPRLALAAATLAAVVPLALAFAAEWWGGIVPCALCLVERWPWRVAIALGVIGMLLPARVLRVALVCMLLAGIGAVAAAGTHVGVEFGFWPSPLPECAAPNFSTGSIADRLRSMPDEPSKECDIPDYPVPAIPISFAQLGLIYALAFSAGLAMLLGGSGAPKP